MAKKDCFDAGRRFEDDIGATLIMIDKLEKEHGDREGLKNEIIDALKSAANVVKDSSECVKIDQKKIDGVIESAKVLRDVETFKGTVNRIIDLVRMGSQTCDCGS